MLRVRVTFAKTEAMRYTGHLDLHRTWERTIRRAGAPLAYTEGFHPHPRIQLAAALPLGSTSDCELADIWLEEALPPDDLRAALERAAPPGIRLLSLEAVDLREPALQTRISSAEYQIRFPDPLPRPELESRVGGLLAQPHLPRSRRGKAYDLRPLIESLSVPPAPLYGRPGGSPLPPALYMILAAREGATGRPDEVLAALGLDPAQARVRRTALHVKRENVKRENVEPENVERGT